MALPRLGQLAWLLSLAIVPAICVPLPAQESDQPEADFTLKADRLAKIVFLRPRVGTALDLLVRHYQDAGREQQLVERVKARLSKTPDDPRAHLAWGLICQRLQGDEAATEAFRRARELAADDYYPRMMLADELLRAQDTEGAIAELSEAIQLKAPRQDYLQMARQLAQLYQRTGDRQRAQETWNQIAQRFSTDVRVLSELANLLQNDSQFDTAVQLWKSVEQQTRNDPTQQFDARLHIAEIYLKTGKHSDAVRQLGLLLNEVKPESWRAENVRRLIEQALLDQAGPEALVTFWSQRLQKNPDELSAMIQLARALTRVNRDRAAEQQFRMALDRAPKNRDLHEGLIALLIRRGDIAGAVSQAEKLAEVFPNDADVYWQLGHLHLQNRGEGQQQSKQNAIRAWRKIADIRPDDAAAAVRVAELCRAAAAPRASESAMVSVPNKLAPIIREQETRLLKTAEEYYREAIRRDPDAAQYHEYLGEFLHWMDRPQEAVAAWMEMASSDSATAWHDVSRVLGRYGYLEPAVDAARKAVEADSANVEFRKRYVELLSQAGRHQEARKALSSWSTDDQGRWEEISAQLSADIAVDAKDIDQEIRDLRQQAQAHPKDYWKAWSLAMLLAASGQPVEAAQWMNHAVEQRPDDARLRRRYAVLLEAANRPELAAEQYRRLVILEPERRRDDLQRIVDLELRQNRLAPAAAAAQQLVQAAPTDPESHLLKATVAMRQGDDKGRIAALQRAAQVAPRDLQVRRQLATALRDGGQSQAALSEAYNCLTLAESLTEKRSILSWILDWTSSLPDRQWLLERVQQDRQQQSDAYTVTLSLVLLLERMNRVEEAIQELSRLQVQHPADVGILEDLVRLTEATNDIPSAVKYQQQRVRFDPKPQTMQHLARLYRQAGRLEDAAAIWDEMLDRTVTYQQAVATVDRLLEQEDLFQAQRFAEAGLAQFPDSWQLAYRSGLIHLAMSQPAAARSALSTVVQRPLPGSASADARRASTSDVYAELLLALQAGEKFRGIRQRVELHGARNPRTLRQFFDPDVLKAGGTASLRATQIYSAVAALILACGADEGVTWLSDVDSDSPSQLRLALIAAWVTHRATDSRRLMERLRQASASEPLPRLLTLLNPPYWDSETHLVPVAELRSNFDWLGEHQPRMQDDVRSLFIARLFYHPDQSQVRQLTRRLMNDAEQFAALPPIIPLVHLASDAALNERFLQRVAELFPGEAGTVLAENDLQAVIRLAIEVSDWNDEQQVRLVARMFDALLARSKLTTLSRGSLVASSGADPLGKLVQQIQKDATTLEAQRLNLRRQVQLPPGRTRGLEELAWVPRQQEVVRSAINGTFVIGNRRYVAAPPPVSYLPTSKPIVWFPVPTDELDRARLDLLGAIAVKMAEVDRTDWWLDHLRDFSHRESVDRRSFELAGVTAIWQSGREVEAIRQLELLTSKSETSEELRLLSVQAHLQRDDLPSALRTLNEIRHPTEQADALRRAIARQWGQLALVSTLEAHTGTVTSVAFSPDGKWLASSGVDRTVRVWDTATHELRETLTDHTDIVLSVSYSPRGDLLASTGYDRLVRLWNVADLKPLAALRAHQSAVRAAVFSPDGQILATAGDDRVVILWDVTAEQPLARLEGHAAPILSLSFNRAGTTIASSSSDGSIRLWHVPSRRLTETLTSSDGAARSIKFLNGDDRLVAGYDGGVLAVWRRDDQGWTVARHVVDAAVRSVAYDEQRSRIAIGLDDHALQLRDADTGDEQLILRGHTARVVTVAFAPGGEQLASAGFDGAIKLWSTVEPVESR